MTLQQFINEYGNHVISYKKHDNGVIRVKFDEKTNCMWLKRRFYEITGKDVKMSSNHSPTYWFN